MLRLANASMQPSLKQGELERLVDVFQQNPRSMAFLPLAQAYIGAGRPGDAIDVLEQGLAIYPDHAEGRLSLGRALAAMHRWPEAEVELIKVVKLDRYNQQGFSLLGEILARRGNYDVAVKALTRACDLDPTDDQARRILERARVRRPLDPPPPIAGETQNIAQRPHMALGSSRPAFEEMDEGPTVVTLAPPEEILHADLSIDALTEPRGAEPAHEPEPEPPPLAASAPSLLPMAPPLRRAPTRAPAPAPATAQGSVPAPAPAPAPASALAPMPAPAPAPAVEAKAQNRRRRKSTSRPARRPEDPSAEDFYNEMLGAGAVIARSRDIEVDDGLPVETWGQRVKRPFLWLWLGLVTLTVGGAGWYLGDMWARNAAVRRHLDAARADLVEMTAASLSDAEGEATRAIARDPASVEAVAMLANARAFALLVYGDGQLIDVETAISAARQRAKELKEGGKGKRELILAHAAFVLAAQSRGSDVTKELEAARADLDGALASWPEEPLVYWLNGMSRQAAGDRQGAREALRQAQSLGLVMARVALADMDLDEGAHQAALAGYDEALKAAPQYSLALAGRALARAEAGLDPKATLAEITPNAEVRVDGKRAEAWHRLAVSRLALITGDRERARTELDGAVATGTAESRFLARAALAMLDDGRFEDAFTARTRVRSRAADVLLPSIDAELLLAGGRPDEALRTIGAAEDPRARAIRGRALLDLGRAAEAVTQLTEAAAKAPHDAALAGWLALAKLTADPREGTAALARLATADAPPLLRALLGEGHLLTGEADKARRAFDSAIEGNPLVYRAAARLAEMDLDGAAAKPADAEAHARAALASAPGYLPAHAALGRALVLLGRQSEAAPELQLAVDAGRARAVDELAYAEAALASGQPDAARAALQRAKEKGATPEALARVATLVDPQMAAEVAQRDVHKNRRRGRR